jgi:outer membrane protein OmpA-like peptidoglycan-associated protein
MKLGNASAVLSLVIALSLAGAACATKRHVRESLAPVQNQINQTQNQVQALKDQINQHRQRIGDLDRRLATAVEKAAVARTRSAEALKVASRASDTASEAARRGDTARATAQQTQRALVTTNHRMDEVFPRLDNYRLIFSEKIYFAFSQSGLAKEEQPKLDRAIRRIRGMRNYIIEIEGFADSSGDIRSNRKLSRRRADAVVHYLVVEHGVPLRTIWELGAGADFPQADNQTPTARRENRRVDLRIYSLDAEGHALAAGDGSHP